MVGFQIIIQIDSSSLLFINIILAVYSMFLKWCFSQLSSRITSVRDERMFMFSGFFAIELFQLVVYATVVHVEFWNWDFVLTLAFQELFSLVHNVGVIRLLQHLTWRVLGRETVLDHPFGSRRGMKTVVHWALMDSIAELIAIGTVYTVIGIETLLTYVVDDVMTMTCTLSGCLPKTVDSQLIFLYSFVFLVRIVVMFLERVVLLRLIRYYTPMNEPRLAIDSHRFRSEVCKLLDGDSYVLILAVFVLVMAYASTIHNGF
jgi:hypothetical protein